MRLRQRAGAIALPHCPSRGGCGTITPPTPHYSKADHSTLWRKWREDVPHCPLLACPVLAGREVRSALFVPVAPLALVFPPECGRVMRLRQRAGAVALPHCPSRGGCGTITPPTPHSSKADPSTLWRKWREDVPGSPLLPHFGGNGERMSPVPRCCHTLAEMARECPPLPAAATL